MRQGGQYSAQFMASLGQMMPPGVQATGRPGELYIEGVGVRMFADMRQDVIYDRVQIPATNAAGTELVWFRDIQGKTRLATNMVRASALPEGQESLVYRVNFVIRPNVDVRDVRHIFALGYGEFILDDDNRVLSGPLITFKNTHGLSGQIMTTNTTVSEGNLTSGVASPGANPRLMLPIYLAEGRTFNFRLHFYETCDLPSVAAAEAWVILDSLITRPLR